MKVVFLSNYYNHHQSSFSMEMNKLTDNGFYFIETAEMTMERKSLGYEIEKPKFVLQYYEKEQKDYCINLINEADVVIYGSAPYSLIVNRLKQEKLTLIYSERLFKKKYAYLKVLILMLGGKNYKHYSKYKNAYLLCASAFSSYDYNRLGAFKNKAFKWGYFPPIKEYKVDDFIKSKTPNSILWCGRFIDWKHPEYAIEVAKRLKSDGYNFSLNIIGTGELESTLKETVAKNGLERNVKFLGAMKPTEVRENMEKSSIYLFTSDKGEGWGAVLNEAMNSACAVVSSHAIGATPYLIKDKENGLIFKSEDIKDLYNKVKYLLDNEEKAKEIGKKAYETIVNEWNAKNAANKLIVLIKNLLKGEKCTELYNEGVCSKSIVIKDNWYK